LYLLCCFHLLQHNCIFFAVSTCCSIIGSTSTLLLLSIAAPLYYLCCFHLLQHHCTCSRSAASTCCSTTVSFLLLHPVAATPLHHLCCLYLLHHHCNLLCCSHLLQHDSIFPASTCCSTTASSLLLPFAASQLNLPPLNLIVLCCRVKTSQTHNGRQTRL